MLKIENYFKENGSTADIKCLQGYADLVDDLNFIYKVISDKKVPLADSTLKIRSNEDEKEWHYIRCQSDIDDFMEKFVGFHDATLDKMLYEENYGKRQINIIFNNSRWYGIAELVLKDFLE